MNQKALAIIPASILFLSSFFVVYFIQNPQDLPFSFELFRIISQVTSVALAIPMLYGLVQYFSWPQDVWKLTLVFLYPLIIESIAIVTKFPYSGFEYGDILGNLKVFGLVPWSVSLSWSPIFFLSLVMVERNQISKPWLKILLGAIYMTSFDIILDPGATNLGFWIWDNPGWYYGVPWMNFFGWLVTSSLAFWGFYSLFPSRQAIDLKSGYWLSVSGIWSLAFWIGIAVWLGYWPLALAGFGYLIYSLRVIGVSE